MKTLLTAAFLIILALIWFNRERVYLRDPLATVYLDTIPQTGIQVFINHSNEVLLEKDDPPHPYRLLIQRAAPIPGTPTVLRCIHWMACLTDSDHPTLIPLAPNPAAPTHHTAPNYNPQTTITNRETSFTLPDNTHLRITLR